MFTLQYRTLTIVVIEFVGYCRGCLTAHRQTPAFFHHCTRVAGHHRLRSIMGSSWTPAGWSWVFLVSTTALIIEKDLYELTTDDLLKSYNILQGIFISIPFYVVDCLGLHHIPGDTFCSIRFLFSLKSILNPQQLFTSMMFYLPIIMLVLVYSQDNQSTPLLCQYLDIEVFKILISRFVLHFVILCFSINVIIKTMFFV